jgi:DHA1 family tetracycline resistance protein-like MFS transporter
VGFILGPVMGGLLGDINVHWPFFLAGTMCLINCVYGYFVLPESLPEDRRRTFELSRANPFSALARLRSLQGVETLMWIMGLSILAQFCLHTSWFLYTEFKFGWTPRDNGLSLFAVGMMAVLVQGGLLRQVQKRVPLHLIVRIGLVSSTFAFFAWGAVPEGWMMYVVIAANVFGYMVQPGMQSLVANAVDPSRQGESMGAVSSINSVAAMVGPLLGTPLLAAVSHYPQGDWHLGAPFYLCAAIQAVAAIIGLRYFAKHRHEVHAERVTT